MDRRKALERAGMFGGVAVMALANAPRAIADDDDQSLIGAWIGSTNAGPAFPPFEALFMFAPGGGMVTSSSIDLSPRSLSTPGYGAWRRSSHNAFSFTFDAFVFDPQGNPSGTVEAHSTVTVNQAQETFSGPFTFQVTAPNGQVVFSGSGTHQAKRIRA